MPRDSRSSPQRLSAVHALRLPVPALLLMGCVTAPASPVRPQATPIDPADDRCRLYGLCATIDGRDVPTPAGCQASTFCRMLGACSVVGDGCAAETREDCTGSELCAILLKGRSGYCAVESGGCSPIYTWNVHPDFAPVGLGAPALRADPRPQR